MTTDGSIQELDEGQPPIALDRTPGPAGAVPPIGAADSFRWFGYIAVGIAMTSMLIGVVGAVCGFVWFVRWLGS